MDGDAGRFIENQQVLVLPQNGQREIHRMEIWVVTGWVGHIYRQPVAGAATSGHRDRVAIAGDAAFAPFYRLEQGGG